MVLNQSVIGHILSNADPSNIDRLINRCTVQLWGGKGANRPIVYGILNQRDGSQGLTFLDFGGTTLFTSNGEPTPMYIGDGRVTRTPKDDGLLRLAPDAQRYSLINHYTGGGSWNWYPDRAVINDNPKNYDNHASKWRVKFFEFGAGPFTSKTRTNGRPSTTQTAAGSISFYKPGVPSWFINGGGQTLNKLALRTGHNSAEAAAFRVRFLKLGPDLERAYYKRLLETDSAAKIACCKGNYVEGVANKDQCARNNFTSGSYECDVAVAAACPPGTTDPFCGCSENHAGIQGIPKTTRQFQQVRAFPQCFVDTCTHRDAYKFSNMRTSNGGSNCPNITICEQNVDLATRAKLLDSGIMQRCNQDSGNSGGGGAGGGGLDTRTQPSYTPAGPSVVDVVLIVAGFMGIAILALGGSAALWAVGFGTAAVAGWAVTVSVVGLVIAVVVAIA